MKNLKNSILRRIEIWLSYLTISLSATLCFLYFRLLNKMKVVGRKNIPRKSRNVLLVSNHRSLHDSWIIGVAGYFPETIFYPSQPPYNLAAKENFFKNWLARFTLKLCRTIPIERSGFSRGLLFSVISLLNKSNVCIFYQGTRSLDITSAKDGTAFIIANSSPSPIVVPIYLDGTEKLFGGGPGVKPTLSSYLPRFPWLGRKIAVVFGKPIDFDDLLQNRKYPGLYDRISERIVENIKTLASSPPLTENQTKNPHT